VREIQRPRREHADASETGAHLVRHRAQILADDHATVALALEAQDAEELVERITDIRARIGLRAGWNPVQAQQSHDVVDAQRAGGAHVPAQRRDERRVRGIAQALGDERRKPPVLTGRVVEVRRRADEGAGRVKRRVGPAFGAARVDADREIVQQSDVQSERGRAFRRRAELHVELPLEVGMKFDALRVRCRECSHRLALYIVER
jgi:hypothetical protein